MRVIRWVWSNILFVFTLFLLAFIPLYPKLPLVDVKNTWVYVRGEDFVVVLFILVWLALLFRKKISLQTPLTVPILLYWITGAVATIHSVLLILPGLADVFPNVAFLSFLRHIEYMSLFFIAVAGMRDKTFLRYVITILMITLFLVAMYGFGQKYFGFYAYLTMNEEFAKGIPIQLSQLSRVPSTFGGHYDLAGYLVLVVPIFTSLLFGIRNRFVRILLFLTIVLGFGLMFMTVSRVSFFVLIIALLFVLLFQKRKLMLLFAPLVLFIGIGLLLFSPALVDRFGNTIKEVDVLVDAKTGETIGHVSILPSEQFAEKTIVEKLFHGKNELDMPTSSNNKDIRVASTSAQFLLLGLPAKVAFIESQALTGESLPQGTGYINLALSPATQKIGEFLYTSPKVQAKNSSEVRLYHGDFIIKRAAAYDLSFTTRFQGEWPRAITAFKRNILFGSGYASVSLAVDNNYLRILGETGLLGFSAFFGILLIFALFVRKVYSHIDSPVAKAFVIGLVAGISGLMLNGIFIDVFEASKIAFLLWLLVGITVGLLSLYDSTRVSLVAELKRALTTPAAVTIYLLTFTVVLFSPMIGNYFVGDDFTWLRWAADCKAFTQLETCPSTVSRIAGYFTESDGFFFRPGTKVFFLFMYKIFWLNQTVYHAASLIFHFTASVLLFLLARKIFRATPVAIVSAFLFLVISGYAEEVFWISSIGHLINAVFILGSLLCFIAWEERRKIHFFFACLFLAILSLLFHELGVIAPVLMLLYKFVKDGKVSLGIFKNASYILLLIPIPLYLFIRWISHSHWLSGDYSYNLVKLPFNVVGNAIGYTILTIFGPLASPYYQALRNVSRENVIVSTLVMFTVFVAGVIFYRFIRQKMDKEDKKIFIFGAALFLISLLPFLGFGNIASRYSYLASIGIIIILVLALQKIYKFFLATGRFTAFGIVATIILVFSLLHIMQIQQLHSDWHEAGLRTKQFFVSLDLYFADYWTREPISFYFVDVPIRHNEAWVFPVGLSDAIWLAYRNPDVKVYQLQTRQEAESIARVSANEKIFVFDGAGKIVEYKKGTRL